MDEKMHPSNWMFQSLIGKTVEAVEYVDDFDEGITLRFTDGSFLCVCEEMQAGRIQVAASIVEAEFTGEQDPERVALSEIYATLSEVEQHPGEEDWWLNPPDALREAARIIDQHMRSA